MDDWIPPNELLALAYMEDDSISVSSQALDCYSQLSALTVLVSVQYHDDGEDQLNGVISTLSLGSPAVMKLRMKKTKKARGGKKQEQQNDKNGELIEDENNEKGSNKPVLEIQLRHGDVVTMCDTRLQAFTEASV